MLIAEISATSAAVSAAGPALAAAIKSNIQLQHGDEFLNAAAPSLQGTSRNSSYLTTVQVQRFTPSDTTCSIGWLIEQLYLNEQGQRAVLTTCSERADRFTRCTIPHVSSTQLQTRCTTCIAEMPCVDVAVSALVTRTIFYTHRWAAVMPHVTWQLLSL